MLDWFQYLWTYSLARHGREQAVEQTLTSWWDWKQNLKKKWKKTWVLGSHWRAQPEWPSRPLLLKIPPLPSTPSWGESSLQHTGLWETFNVQKIAHGKIGLSWTCRRNLKNCCVYTAPWENRNLVRAGIPGSDGFYLLRGLPTQSRSDKKPAQNTPSSTMTMVLGRLHRCFGKIFKVRWLWVWIMKPQGGRFTWHPSCCPDDIVP